MLVYVFVILKRSKSLGEVSRPEEPSHLSRGSCFETHCKALDDDSFPRFPRQELPRKDISITIQAEHVPV